MLTASTLVPTMDGKPKTLKWNPWWMVYIFSYFNSTSSHLDFMTSVLHMGFKAQSDSKWYQKTGWNFCTFFRFFYRWRCKHIIAVLITGEQNRGGNLVFRTSLFAAQRLLNACIEGVLSLGTRCLQGFLISASSPSLGSRSLGFQIRLPWKWKVKFKRYLRRLHITNKFKFI